MARIPSGEIHLVPMTIKVDQELKTTLANLSRRERRTPSSASAILVEYGARRWEEEGTLQRLIDEVDKKSPRGSPRRGPHDR